MEEGRTVAGTRMLTEEEMPPRRSLEEQVLTVLERALAEGRSEAAEHLLRALEALCGGAPPGTPLADAHPTAAGERAPRRPLRAQPQRNSRAGARTGKPRACHAMRGPQGFGPLGSTRFPMSLAAAAAGPFRFARP